MVKGSLQGCLFVCKLKSGNFLSRNLTICPLKYKTLLTLCGERFNLYCAVQFYSSIAASTALASWSGQLVGLCPQVTPFRRRITSCAGMPCAKSSMPRVLPGQPLINFTCLTMPPSTSTSIAVEQVPCVLYNKALPP